MSGIDQEMWQDFVVEAEENMQELEPNLLLLEQDPENTSLLNDCFRNMHSIKGAANYMGLENTATLSHRMENLFDHVRQGDITLDENAMNVLFDGLDRVKQLVREVSDDHEEKSSIDDILQELEAIISGENSADSVSSHGQGADEAQTGDPAAEEALSEPEDDAELLAIFSEELLSRMQQLEKLEAPVDKGVVQEILQDMIRVTNYIGIDALLSGLEKEADRFMSSGAEGAVEKEELQALLGRIGPLFSSHLGEGFLSSSPEPADTIGLAGEEDEELYRIFLEFVQEEGRPLANIPDEPDSRWLESCRAAVEKLTASAHYMDYHDVVSLLEEWDERLVEALSSITEDQPFNGEPLRRLWARFCAMLPGLENYIEPVQGMEATGEGENSGAGAATNGQSVEESPGHESADAAVASDAFDFADDMFEGLDFEYSNETQISENASEHEHSESETSREADSFHGIDSALDNMFDQALPENAQEKAMENLVENAEVIRADDTSDSISHDTGHDAAGSMPEEGADVSVNKADDAAVPAGPGPQSPFSPPGPAAAAPSAGPAQPRSSSRETSKLVRVDLAKVEGLLEDVGELVVLRAAMLQITDDMKELYSRWLDERQLSSAELKPLKQIMIRTSEQTATLEKVVHQLQDGVMKMRMLPVGTLFNRYPRMIRDLSRKLGKKVDLRIYGEGTALDKRVIEHITDPLQHIVRNAVDHGIETPDVRERQGKAAAGTLTLNAGQEGNFVVITISDDGRGLDREAIIQKAVSNGIINGETARTMSDERVWNMIFLPGISTASRVSDTSGRGVGMDVVKNNIERLGGQISVTSSPGRGTSITLRIPLTLAIIQTLLVRVGDQNMAIPLSAVQETFRIYADEISSIEGFEMISLRQETLPLIRLGRVFRGTGAEENPEKLFVVRVKMQELEAGLAVDRFVGQQEVVIKPLADYLTDQPGFSGATILGDGTVALILDIPAVLERARSFTQKRQQLMEQAALGISQGEAAPVFH